MVKLSIIIPVYNVEKYIKRCLDSVFDQNISSSVFEVIVVNDGTQDNSMSIVNDFVKKYDNIVIVEQENKGLSVARNVGLEIAVGDYVWFIDSDDYIAPNSLNFILGVIDKVHASVYSIVHRRVYEKDGVLSSEIMKVEEGMVSMDKFTKMELCCSCVPFYVFNRDFFIENKLFFHEGVFHEDLEFLAKLKVCCNYIYICPFICYYYLIRETGSISTSFNIKRCYDSLLIADELTEYKNKYAIRIKDKLSLNRSIAYMLIHSLLLVLDLYKSNSRDIDLFMHDVASKITIRNYIGLLVHYRWSFYVFGCMLSIFISPRLFLNLYSKYKNI